MGLCRIQILQAIWEGADQPVSVLALLVAETLFLYRY
jgi:hypothetical protein